MHQCYYCEQIFDSKEDLYQHVEIHSDIERNKEIADRQKKTNKNQAQKLTKKNTVQVGINKVWMRYNNFIKIHMDWVELLLQKSCDRTLQKGEVLHSLFHMIEVNEKTLDHIQTDKRDFGPELEELKQTEIKDIDFHLKYYRSLVNYINSIPENKIINRTN